MRCRVASFLSCASLAVSACGDPSGPTPTPITGPLSLSFGSASVSDTIEAKAGSVVVTVVDSKGTPVADTTIEFSIDGATLAADNASFVLRQAAVKTNAEGMASIFVRLDTVAGAYYVRAVIRGAAVKDSISVTVHPGNLVSLTLAPRDSVVYVNNTYVVRTARLDRKGNRRSELPTYTMRTPGVITIPESTVARGAAFGRTTLVAELGTLKDSVIVSVVPTAVIAAYAAPAVSAGPPNNMLHVVNLDGSGHATITTGFDIAQSRAPRFTPDGSKILYHDDVGSGLRLFSINVNGSGKVQLSASVNGNQESQPQVSRDGSMIYYTALVAGNDLAIWQATSSFGSPVRLTPAGEKEFTPTPSPDGSRLAFFGGHASQPIQIRTLATGAVDTTAVFGGAIRWSPVGNEIAYVIGSELRVYDTAARSITTLDATSAHHFQIPHVEWSSDGAWILSCSTYGGTSLNPTQLVLVRRSPVTVIPLVWSRTWNLCQAAWKP